MRLNKSSTMLLALPLVAVALAGCTTEEGGLDMTNPYDSFEEAKAAGGPIVVPVEGSGMQLKVLEPMDVNHVAKGIHRVVVLLMTEDGSAPVTDAELTLAAHMASHGMNHGTSDEIQPEHVGHGVYIGQTNYIMTGEWELRFDATKGADTLRFTPIVTVTSHTHGDSMDHS
ncbi:MAG: FixH family protein [Thermoplasmatota archaeon]